MLNVVSTVRAHVTSICSVQNITESLASDLLAEFPAAVDICIKFTPTAPGHLGINKSLSASCTFIKTNPRTNRITAEQNSTYRLSTRWRLSGSRFLGSAVSLILTTQERSVSTVYDQSLGMRTLDFRSSLKHVHPTFGLHEEVAKLAEQVRGDQPEAAAHRLAQYLFHLADEQSPCKRLQHVHLRMKEERPLREESGSEREALARILPKDNFDKENYTISCGVQLGRHQYEQYQRSFLGNDVQTGRHRAYLALGGNLGYRIKMIESAIREMSDRGLTVLRTSALYETKPMYLENQEAFINGTCEVCSTDVAAHSRPR